VYVGLELGWALGDALGDMLGVILGAADAQISLTDSLKPAGSAAPVTSTSYKTTHSSSATEPAGFP
jgi:hypothetical protein